jgi:hypothetical protein
LSIPSRACRSGSSWRSTSRLSAELRGHADYGPPRRDRRWPGRRHRLTAPDATLGPSP